MSLSWREYEAAVLAHLRQEFAGAAVRVVGTDGGKRHTIVGLLSGVPRQLDAAAYGIGDDRPFLIVDAKKHSGKVDVKDVESIIGMAEDVGARLAGVIAPDGFTPAAQRRAHASSMRVEVLTIEDALTCVWLPLAREVYPQDWIFRRELALALRRLNDGSPPTSLVECLEFIAYEEWDALVRYAIAFHKAEAERFLLAVAEAHPESDWRYNAVQRLLEHGLLDVSARQRLASLEDHSEILELLDTKAQARDA